MVDIRRSQERRKESSARAYILEKASLEAVTGAAEKELVSKQNASAVKRIVVQPQLLEI